MKMLPSPSSQLHVDFVVDAARTELMWRAVAVEVESEDFF